MKAPETVQGIIISRLAFGNTSLIIRVLTQSAGRLTFLAKGATRPKSSFCGQIDLFYLADFQYQPSRQSEIHTLREIRLLEPNLGLRRSYANLLAVQYFAALVETITEPATPIPQEFDLFRKALGYLAERVVTARVVERFEHRILALSGVNRPEDDLPRAFARLHHAVPTLRGEVLKYCN